LASVGVCARVLGFRLLLGFFGFQLVLRFGLVLGLGLAKVGVWVRVLGFRLVLGFGLRFSASVKRFG